MIGLRITTQWWKFDRKRKGRNVTIGSRKNYFEIERFNDLALLFYYLLVLPWGLVIMITYWKLTMGQALC